MKSILTLAAIAAALAGATVASAQDKVGGHWEWRTAPSFGPKATAPTRTRVWVKDSDGRVASCDCAMMNADAAGCMMNMLGSASRPAG
jgi:hypothetical protein